ncbi:MAG: monovalent cation/H+ antiporter subunit D family protein [Rickettsiales bacterium]|nr:monovalent cation/H+ antiporter subunit D family protein [Rickettsiales bacterium]
MMVHLPILPVIIPLIAAPICALLHRGPLAWLIAALAMATSFATSLLILLETSQGEVLHYALGGWVAPYGIEYRFDPLNALILTLVSGIGTVMAPYALRSVMEEGQPGKHCQFYSMMLLCFAGLLGIVATNDVFNMYVFLEISSLAMYALIAMGQRRRALTSAFEYLILGTIGATFFLIGIGLLYAATGTLNLSDLSTRIASVADLRPLHTAFAFIIIGLSLKAALFPLHIWMTNAYAYAPSVISAFLSATATKVSLYLIIRVIFGLFGYHFSFLEIPLGMFFMCCGVAAIIIASFAAIYRMDVKRLLAFSSVAQVGYIILGIGLATETALTGSIVHLVNHALAKGALFLAVGCVIFRTGGCTLPYFHGLGRKMPWTMAAFALSSLSLIGVPLTAGFISKWLLIQAMIESGAWFLVLVMIAGSALAIIYIGRVLEAAYFRPINRHTRHRSDVPLIMLIPLWTLVLANIYFGINTHWTLGVAEAAVDSLLSGGL